MSKSTNLLISSEDRDIYATNPSPANFRIQLATNITDASKMCLVGLMLPYTFYNIVTGYNDSFTINGNLITIPQGSYNLTELGIQVQTQVQALGGSLAAFQIYYDDIASKIVLSNTSSMSVQFNNANFAYRVGFPQFPSTIYTGTTITSTYPPSIAPLNVCLHISCGQGMFNSNSSMNSATFIIPVNVNKSEYLQFNDKTQYLQETKVTGQLINSIDIRVTDNKNNLLQGIGEWQLILRFDHPDTRANRCQDIID